MVPEAGFEPAAYLRGRFWVCCVSPISPFRHKSSTNYQPIITNYQRTKLTYSFNINILYHNIDILYTKIGPGNGTRTHTPIQEADFKSAASANSAIPGGPPTGSRTQISWITIKYTSRCTTEGIFRLVPVFHLFYLPVVGTVRIALTPVVFQTTVQTTRRCTRISKRNSLSFPSGTISWIRTHKNIGFLSQVRMSVPSHSWKSTRDQNDSAWTCCLRPDNQRFMRQPLVTSCVGLA